MDTPTFDHLGEPDLWRCPKCGEHVLMYQTLPPTHRCRVTPRCPPRTFYSYYTLAEDCSVLSMHLVGADDSDPLLRVEGFDSEGMVRRWHRRSENGELVFYPFDPRYARENMLGYSPQIQRHEVIPRRELERRAARGQHSA